MASTTFDPKSGRAAAFRQGVGETIPLVIGAVPFSLIFGALATANGFTIAQALLCSALVFSGSAQFIAVNLVAVGSGYGVIWSAMLIVHLRHLLYAATLLPVVQRSSVRWRIPLGALLTDETFAIVEARRRRDGGAPHAQWHFLGSCLVLWTSWQLATAVGAVLGAGVPALRGWGLEFAMVASFIGIVVPTLKTPPFWGAAIAAGSVAAVAAPLPYQSGLLLAAAAGIGAGLLLERRGRAAR
jgi:4-azaleucine resistance transporter AzlC